MQTNEKAHLTIWEMYCQKHGINTEAQAINVKGYDKVNRQKVDEHLFKTRVKDDDPLIDTGE